MKTLAHSPSPVGLSFSILDQFASTASFVSGGKLITIKTDHYDPVRLNSKNRVILQGAYGWIITARSKPSISFALKSWRFARDSGECAFEPSGRSVGDSRWHYQVPCTPRRLYSRFFLIFLSQFFLNALTPPKNLSSVLVCSLLAYLIAVSSRVQMRSAAWARIQLFGLPSL